MLTPEKSGTQMWDDADAEAQIAHTLWGRIQAFVRELVSYYRLMILIFAISLGMMILIYATATPTYTAVAVIGPPGPSPVSTFLGGGGLDGSTVRRFLGSSSSGSRADPFQQYLQLLDSAYLAQELAERDGMLQVVYSGQWDAERRQWLPRGAAHSALSALKRFLHQPVVEYPDSNQLQSFLSSSLKLAQAPSVTASTFLSMGTNFMVVSLTYPDRTQAEKILTRVLDRADQVIREQQRRDVLARISYIQNELPNVTQTDQREALIQTLSSQEDLRIMLVADQHYAYTVVEPPHASPIPTSPIPISKGLFIVGVITLLVHIIIVILAQRFRILQNAISGFRMKLYGVAVA